VGNETDTLTEQLARYQQIERLNSQLRSHVKDMELGAKAIQADLRAKTQALSKCQNILIASKKVIRAKNETLQKLANKLKIERNQLNRYKQRLSEYSAQENKHVEALKVELDNVNNHCEVYKSKCDKNNQHAIALSEQLDNTQLKLDELACKFENTSSELVNSKALLTEQNESVDMLTATVKIRDEMVEYYEKQLKEGGAENTLLSNKLEGLANEFAKVATAMMKVKSLQAKENKRNQEEKETFTLTLNNVEHKLVVANNALEEKEKALQDQVVVKQGKSKLHQLERQLKHVKKKLKAASYSDQNDRNVTILALQDSNLAKDQADQKVLNAVPSDVSLLGRRYEIEKIRGIGASHGDRLRKLGITNSHDLLQCALSNQDVQVIAQKISCKPTDIVLWKKMADFLRIKGVNAEFAQLLALSHLNSVKDIALSNAMQLLDKMKAARKKERRIRHMPELDDINKWIQDAKNLEVINGNSSGLSS
jgi:transcriptional regulator with XRE-family HTH domain